MLMGKILAITLLTAAALSANAQSLTEKIEVSLVNVDVTVTSHGSPAHGLTRDGFQVFEDGIAQPLTNFYAVEPPPASIKKQTAATAAADASLADPADERFRRKVLVIVDNRHVTKHNRDAALAALERFVDNHFAGGTYDWSIAVIADQAHLVLPLTSDKATLHAAVSDIRRMMANPERFDREEITRLAPLGTIDSPESEATAVKTGAALGETMQSIVDRGLTFEKTADAARTVRAIRDSIHSFASAPGRKVILLVTGSLGFSDAVNPLNANAGSFNSGPAAVGDTARLNALMLALLIREANAENVSFYIVNSEGLNPDSDATSANHGLGLAGSIGRDMGTGNTNALVSMYWLARETGGRLMPGNGVDRSLKDFDQASSSFYSLAYKPDHGDDGKYHTIKVVLKRSGYELSYRTGYSGISVTTQLARAMESPLGVSMQHLAIPIEIVAGNSTPRDGGVIVPLQATVAAKNLQFIPTGNDSVAKVDFYVSVFDDRGRVVSRNHVTREAHAPSGTEANGNFIENRQLLVKRGVPYRVVVGVHDQVTDAIGISSRTVQF
jgi:VWFA-related protein